MNVTSAIWWPTGKIYFFSGPKYYRYSPDLLAPGPAGSMDPGFPLDVVPPPGSPRNWDRLMNDIRGALVWPLAIGGKFKAYFFTGENPIGLPGGTREVVYRYDVADDKVDSGYPRLTRDEWSFFPPGSDQARVDAAIVWAADFAGGPPPPGARVYFFVGDSFYSFDFLSGRNDTPFPNQINGSNGFPGLWSTVNPIKGGFVWPTPIDGGLKAFFFLDGGLYTRLDLATRKVDAGFPKMMSDPSWPGAPA